MTHEACPDWAPRLSAYHDQQDTAHARRAVEAHLHTCPACRAALAALDADRARFTQAYAADTIDVRGAVLEEIAAMSPSPVTIAIPIAWYRWLLGLGSAAAVGMLALLVFAVLPGPMQTLCTSSVREVATATDMSKTTAVKGQPQWADDWKVTSDTPMGKATDMLANCTDTTIPFRMQRNGVDAKSYDARECEQLNGAAQANPSFGANGLLMRPTRNYGVAGGIQMAYDVNYTLRVRHALAQARQAGAILTRHGGFVVNFTYQGDEGQIPTAGLHGKVPSDQADAALRALEKLGRVTSLTVAGEDLTAQFQQYLDEMAKQREHAARLGTIEDRSGARVAMSAEEQRHWAAQQAAAAHRNLLGVQAKSKLVEITAVFTESTVPAHYGVAQFQGALRNVIATLVLLLGFLAVVAGIVALVLAPIALIRYLRRRAVGA